MEALPEKEEAAALAGGDLQNEPAGDRRESENNNSHEIRQRKNPRIAEAARQYRDQRKKSAPRPEDPHVTEGFEGGRRDEFIAETLVAFTLHVIGAQISFGIGDDAATHAALKRGALEFKMILSAWAERRRLRRACEKGGAR